MSKGIVFKYSKIVVFDETGALDMLDQKNGGRLEYIEKVTKSKTLDIYSKIFKEINIENNMNLIVRMFSKLEIDKQINKQLTNTIKADFIKEIEGEITDYNLEYIQNYKLNILEGTSTYLKTISPMTKLIKDFSKINNDNELENINFNNFEEFVDEMKSYHEFLAVKGNSYKIIRVNTKHLRNDYKLSDLRNMNLNIVGVKIGQTTIDNIKFDFLLETDEENVYLENSTLEEKIDELSDDKIDKIIAKDIENESGENSDIFNINPSKKIDIIDVIIAGVK
ncbi:DUF6414 family protein [Mammaliicoccus sciuri]|uniref:DUF6414 family protein n=1 Tax=Mammaliicoccus sciuri TaxID=1296 RepID=UPI001FB297E5|nr:DUF6414 family protein [Mammaliicoccus sciuri]MCJ0965305.1 DUF6414 family protein [Mammaliicoccus sciuri]